MRPTFPPYPIKFSGNTICTVFYESDPGAIAAVLPPPLRAVSNLVAVHLYHMPDVEGMGIVNECNVMVSAALDTPEGEINGGFTFAQFIDSDSGMAHGREAHGQPKKYATIDLQTRGDLIVGTVSRNKIDILTATTPFKVQTAQVNDMQEYFDTTNNINYKVIPGIDGQTEVRQLTARRLTDVKVNGCWRGPATLELRPNALAPVYQLPVVRVLEAFYWQADFTLVTGRVLHNYLTPNTQEQR